MKRKIALTFCTRMAGSVLSMLVGVLVARLLGPAGRGDFFLAVTIIGMVQQLGALGLHSSNIYLVAGDKKLYAVLADNSFIISAFIWLVSAPVLIVVLPFIFPRVDIFMAALIVLAVGPSLYYLLMSNLLLGVDRVSAFNVFELLSRTFPLLFTGILAILLGLDAHYAVFSTVSAVLASAMLLFYYATPSGRPRFNAALFRSGVNYSIRAYFAAMLGFMLSRAGGVLLGFEGKAVENGNLSVALQLADVMIMLPATIGLILFPRLVGDECQRGKLTLFAAKIVAAFMFVACIAAYLLADILIPLVFGKGFLESAMVLKCMLPGIFALSLISIISQYLAAHGIPWALIASWAIGLLLVLGGSWHFMPAYGAKAVAISMSVSYCIVLALLAFLAIRKNFSSKGLL
ncbi:polysaccharide biosynthesis C-terminal domain-containing protein [Microvirgula aerodenitrificans]|uniref:oligosaccharide flippase family protein n=1 Tax=Microvirgula aerodenitrificans TaxID=57480 RepID=UPI002F401339